MMFKIGDNVKLIRPDDCRLEDHFYDYDEDYQAFWHGEINNVFKVTDIHDEHEEAYTINITKQMIKKYNISDSTIFFTYEIEKAGYVLPEELFTL